jgi:NADH-quinone oxidoreductase subunit C/D
MSESTVLHGLLDAFGEDAVTIEETTDAVPTVWATRAQAPEMLRHLKEEGGQPFRMLYDLTAVDERERRRRADGLPDSDFTVVYHLLSLDRVADVRIKVPLSESDPKLESITRLWPSADWYEREVWDLFGIRFSGHPNLRRILLPPTWQGHPLRKDHPARATDMARFELTPERQEAEQEALRVRRDEWGLSHREPDRDLLILNLGPQHPGTHGVLRVILQLDGEAVVDAVPDIGYHHRGAEKMGERQSWHTFIPYTDRIDYLGGVMNNLPYVLAVEKLAGIEVPERVEVIRVMLCELFRIISHLVWYGTFAQDIGALSPVFYMFSDREHAFDVVAAICGDRMHPNWFRIGGVAQDLPDGWQDMMRAFCDRMDRSLAEYDRMVLPNRIFKDRTVGIGAVTLDEAEAWGITGPMLRACGLEWDLRKKRPYSGYDRFDFDIPTATEGDCYARALVRVEEMRQSLRIIRQCIDGMPAGEHKSRHPLTTPPLKHQHTMYDIETLITHFLGVTWGPVIPPGEAHVAVEASKGINGYYLVSDGDTMAYRVRIRTPSFAHMQTLPLMSRDHSVADVLAILGSIDFVLADVDR